MRTLQLIRPWRLQAVRQTTSYQRQTPGYTEPSFTPCLGPQDAPLAAARATAQSRGSSAARNAPVSSLIFATGNNPRFGR